MFKLFKFYIKHKHSINQLLPLLQAILEASKDGLTKDEKRKLQGLLLTKITKLI